MMKGRFEISDKYGVNNLLAVLNDPNTRTQWDTALDESKLIKRYSTNVLTKAYVVKIPMVFMNNRDFVEKQIIFKYGNVFYVYGSSINDKFCPLRSGVTRGNAMLVASKITHVGNKIVVETVSQIDFKFSLPNSVLGGKMADGLNGYRTELIAKLEKMKN